MRILNTLCPATYREAHNKGRGNEVAGGRVGACDHKVGNGLDVRVSVDGRVGVAGTGSARAYINSFVSH